MSLSDGDIDIVGMYGRGPLVVHGPNKCAGETCCIHNPSDHPLKNRPLHWRGHIMERICKDGVGHPDPDDLAYRERAGIGGKFLGIHGCDGCCHNG